MAQMQQGMSMVPASCMSAPTTAQQKAAVAFVNQTVAAVTPYESLDAAKAAGYVPVTPTGQRVVHYINYSIARQRPTADPTAIPALVYVNTKHGAVLSGAVYLDLAGDPQHPAQPGGCLTQWHLHSDLCFKGGAVVGNDNEGTCPDGAKNLVTRPMMHVWMVPVPGGPLAPDPSPRAEVVAAAQAPPLASPNGTA